MRQRVYRHKGTANLGSTLPLVPGFWQANSCRWLCSEGPARLWNTLTLLCHCPLILSAVSYILEKRTKNLCALVFENIYNYWALFVPEPAQQRQYQLDIGAWGPKQSVSQCTWTEFPPSIFLWHWRPNPLWSLPYNFLNVKYAREFFLYFIRSSAWYIIEDLGWGGQKGM